MEYGGLSTNLRNVKLKLKEDLSILINRKTSEIMVMFSASGGINIEEIASKDPSKIYIYNFKSLESNIENEINNLSEKLYFNDNQKKELKFILKKLMKLFNDFDASSCGLAGHDAHKTIFWKLKPEI